MAIRTRTFYFVIFFLVCCVLEKSAEAQDGLYQISGITVVDSNEVVPNVHVYNKNLNNVSVSNHLGFFTIAAKSDDTLRFTSVGFETLFVPVVEATKGYLRVELTMDTTLLPSAIIYPLPGKNQLKWALMNLELSATQIQLNSGKSANAGFTRPALHPKPPPPSILNPVSLFYDKVIKQIQNKRIKSNAAKSIPKLK